MTAPAAAVSSAAPPAGAAWWRWRASTLTLAGGIALMALVCAGAAFAALLLRAQEIAAWKQQAATVTLLLAEQTFQSLSSADLLLESVARDIESNPPRDSEDLRRRVVTRDMHETLRDRSTALPQVDVVTIISPEGEMLNSSRRWPVVPFRVLDRDYFQVLSAPRAPRTYLGEPVRSKVDQRWLIFLARRIDNRAGGFGGLVLVGISIEAIAGFFAHVGEELGPEATVSLLRRDFTLVARHPFDEADLGRSIPGGSSADVIERQGLSSGVVMRSGAHGFGGEATRHMAAVRMVEKYPLVINVTIPESLYLGNWYRSVRTMAWVAGGSLVAIGLALVMAFGLQRRREADRASALDLRLQAETARASNEAKSQFLSMMSHEIRTPLNGVIGANQLLRETALDAHQRELVRASALSADALMAVIDDVLDFSRIEAGKLEFESVDIDLVELVEDALELLAPKAQAKALVLAGWVEPGLPERLQGDPARIRQVLLNLLGNAIKFTDRGEVTLSVHPGRREGESPSLRFEVGDTGIGIAPDRIERLFQVFSQVDSSTLRRHSGTGLGLAISKRLVEMMSGRIGVRSTPGLGSVFWFELPLRPAAVPAADDLATLWQGLAARHVLLIDASSGRRQQLQLLLAQAGCQTVVESDLTAAEGRLEREAQAGRPIDLVVLAPEPGSNDPIAERPPWLVAAPDGRVVPLVLLVGAVLANGDGGASDLAKLTQPVRRAGLAQAMRRALGYAGEAPARPAVAGPPAADVAAAGRPVSGGGARVLLVEDNDVNRLIAEQMLRLHGHRVECAEDGLQALAMLATTRYDIVLMDCQMPGMDGFEAARAIRQGRAGVLDPEVPIVALTANVMRGDQEAALGAGMNDFLPKPVDAAKLAGAVRRWAGRG